MNIERLSQLIAGAVDEEDLVGGLRVIDGDEEDFAIVFGLSEDVGYTGMTFRCSQ